MGSLNGKRSLTPDSDSSWSSEREEGTAPVLVQQDPWCPAREFPEEGTTWVPEVTVRANRLPIFSHITYGPEVKLSAPPHEEMANWMRWSLGGPEVWSRQTNSFCPQGEGQHTAATAVGPFHCSMGPARPEPRVLVSRPGDVFSFLPVEEEEEEEDEYEEEGEEEEQEQEDEEEQDADNSASLAVKTPWIGYPRGLNSGFFNIWRRPPTDPSPELLPQSPFLDQYSEPPAQRPSSFRPPVFRACRRRLVF